MNDKRVENFCDIRKRILTYLSKKVGCLCAMEVLGTLSV